MNKPQVGEDAMAHVTEDGRHIVICAVEIGGMRCSLYVPVALVDKLRQEAERRFVGREADWPYIAADRSGVWAAFTPLAVITEEGTK